MGSKLRASQYQMDDHAAAPDGILETLTVVVSLDVQQPRTQGSLCPGPGMRLDVQQDVVPVKKQN